MAHPTVERRCPFPGCHQQPATRDAWAVCPEHGLLPLPETALHHPRVGGRIAGKYQVLGVLGGGGQGTVFLARDEVHGRHVAIKQVWTNQGAPATEAGQDGGFGLEPLQRVWREARVTYSIVHPHVVGLYEFCTDEVGAVAYLVMEYVPGVPLRKLMPEGVPVRLELALDLILQLLDALDAAHGQGVVHRDIKPDNIMVLRDAHGRPFVKVLDFGLAKRFLRDADETMTAQTRAGIIAGTRRYMAPEQILNRELDQRADLYSVGIILYELLTGEVPFPGQSDDDYGILKSHVQAPVPAIPAERASAQLSAIVYRALAKQPADRFQDARELAAALRQLAPGAAGAGGPEPEGRTRPEPGPTGSGSGRVAGSEPIAQPTGRLHLLLAGLGIGLLGLLAGALLQWQVGRLTGSAATGAVRQAVCPAAGALAPEELQLRIDLSPEHRLQRVELWPSAEPTARRVCIPTE